MKDYTKFRSVSSNNKSRSMDFQSLDHDHDNHFSSSAPHDEEKGSSPKPIPTPNPTPISKYPTPISTTPNSTTPSNKSNTTATTTPNANASTPNNEQIVVEDGGEKFGVILTRNCSVSSTPSSQKFRAENQKQNKALQAAVVRAFSMRRSASVSEGYSRIHDQSDDPFGSPTNADDNKSTQTSSSKNNKNKKGRKILRACKSFFGF